MKSSHVLAGLTLLTLLLSSGCCGNAKGDCEEGVTIKILYDPQRDVEDMAVKWTSEAASGKAIWRSKKNHFFIDETSDVLGEAFDITIVLKDAVLSDESHKPKWKTTVCGEAEGASWCDDTTYEWAEISIDLREEEE
jgi:hypothetical protein